MTVGLLLILVLVYYAYLSCICVCVFVYSCTLGSDKRVLWTHSMMVWTFVYHVCVVVCRCMCICLFMYIRVWVYTKVHEWHGWLLFCSGEWRKGALDPFNDAEGRKNPPWGWQQREKLARCICIVIMFLYTIHTWPVFLYSTCIVFITYHRHERSHAGASVSYLHTTFCCICCHWMLHICILQFVSSDRSSCTDDGLLYIQSSSNPLFQIWSIYAFLYCYKCHSK